MKVTVIVPAFNEKKSIGSVINDLRKNGYKNIIVVDDGSSDGTSEEIKKNKNTVILRHLINRGLGAALGTGLEYAKSQNSEIAVTFDSDGQHKASDIKRMIKPIIKGEADVVIGSRLINWEGMPWDRKIINLSGNILTFILFNVWTTDSQSGLRAFNRRALNLIQIKTDRMEVSSEFFKEIRRNKLRFKEIPIKPIYTKYSRMSGQTNSNAFSVGTKLFLRLFR